MTYNYALSNARAEATSYAIAARAAGAEADRAQAAARRARGFAAATGATLHVIQGSNENLREKLADAQDEIAALRQLLAQAEADRDIAVDYILAHGIKRAA